jgi:hypothetical protein
VAGWFTTEVPRSPVGLGAPCQARLGRVDRGIEAPRDDVARPPNYRGRRVGVMVWLGGLRGRAHGAPPRVPTVGLWGSSVQWGMTGLSGWRRGAGVVGLPNRR